MSLDVVCVPGFLCDERLFAAQLRAFQELPQVRSVAVADVTASSSIESMANDVLAAAPERFVVIGLSMGGIVAAQLAHAAPDRLGGVALLDTNLAAPEREQLERRAAWAERVRDGELYRVVVDELVVPLTRNVAANAGLIVDMALQCGADTFERQNEALLHRRDRRDDLLEFPAPVLIACGSEDGLCPPQLHRDLAARTRRAEFAEVEAAGHLSTIDQPNAVSEMLGTWLNCCEKHQPQPGGGEANEYITA